MNDSSHILVCNDAKKYLRSKKPLVKYHATVFLKYKRSSCPRRVPGPPSVGPPGRFRG